MSEVAKEVCDANEVCSGKLMFGRVIDEDVEVRLLEPHHAGEYFELAYRNRKHIGEWMFWIGDDYTECWRANGHR